MVSNDVLPYITHVSPRGSTDGVDCTVDERDQQWTCRSGKVNITCSVNGSGNSISCLDRKHCPYNEEAERMVLTIYTRNHRNHNLREYTQSFFISEIGEIHDDGENEDEKNDLNFI